MGVQQNCEGIADNRFTLLAGFGDLISWKNHTNASKARSIPIQVRHLSPVGIKPVQVFDFRSVDRTALKKMSPPENRLGFSQAHHLACEVEQPALFGGKIPIEPREGRILATRIVVATLRLTKLIASEQHRYALGEEQSSEKIALLLRAQRIGCGVIGWPFGAAVPA